MHFCVLALSSKRLISSLFVVVFGVRETTLPEKPAASASNGAQIK